MAYYKRPDQIHRGIVASIESLVGEKVTGIYMDDYSRCWKAETADHYITWEPFGRQIIDKTPRPYVHRSEEIPWGNQEMPKLNSTYTFKPTNSFANNLRQEVEEWLEGALA